MSALTHKRTLLFHVQHFLGIGHLVRAFALAQALTEGFHVVLASGGRFPASLTVPPDVQVVQLPALGFDAERVLVSHELGRSVEQVLVQRRHELVGLYDSIRPDVVLIELYPFGRKKLSGELTALLQRARYDFSPPLIAASVRDLLVTGRRDQRRHDDRAQACLEEFFDVVLVHGDRRFAALSETFSPTMPLAVPVEHTGFVGAVEQAMDNPVKANTVVVSAGGGWVGQTLMTAAIEAAPEVHRRHGLATSLIAGPLADDERWAALSRRADRVASVELHRSVPALLPVLREAAASVSQAGYNTAVDLLRADVAAVLVPYGDEAENEQLQRARKFVHHGLAGMVAEEDLSARTLTDALSTALTASRPAPMWDLDGAARSAEVLHRMVTRHPQAAVGQVL